MRFPSCRERGGSGIKGLLVATMAIQSYFLTGTRGVLLGAFGAGRMLSRPPPGFTGAPGFCFGCFAIV
jgi:hypothetical protein